MNNLFIDHLIFPFKTATEHFEFFSAPGPSCWPGLVRCMEGAGVASWYIWKPPLHLSDLHLGLPSPSPENFWQMAIQTFFLEFPASHYSVKEAFPLLSAAAITIFLNWTQICFPLVSVLALYRIDHSDSSFLVSFYFLFFYFPFAGKQHMSQSTEIQTLTSLSNKNKYCPP